MVLFFPTSILGQERVRVVILNARGTAGEAEALGGRLSQEVFKIVKIGKGRKKEDSPLIIVKAPYRKQARQGHAWGQASFCSL